MIHRGDLIRPRGVQAPVYAEVLAVLKGRSLPGSHYMTYPCIVAFNTHIWTAEFFPCDGAERRWRQGGFLELGDIDWPKTLEFNDIRERRYDPCYTWEEGAEAARASAADLREQISIWEVESNGLY